LIVIGGMKCGTSALHYYLDLHPEIYMSKPKELNFFADEPALGPLAREDIPLLQRTRGNWHRGCAWYASHFPADAPVRGESSPLYTAPWFPRVAERMASLVPEAKLLFLVRDPVERAVSHYVHNLAAGRERRGLGAALGAPHSPYVERSRYGAALESFACHFPAASILVLTREDLLLRRRETIRAAYGFAGVDESLWSPRMLRERNATNVAAWRPRRALQLLYRRRLWRYQYRLPEETKWKIERLLMSGGASRPRPIVEEPLRERLAEYLADDVARLQELTGRGFEGWSLGPRAPA
jgi:hypothetical protein